MMRVKLNLTEEELMNKSWISLCLEMADFPYYDYKAEEVITDKEMGANALAKYKKKK
jgi:hypothetical protein